MLLEVKKYEKKKLLSKKNAIPMIKLPYTKKPDTTGIIFLIINLILIQKKKIAIIIARGIRIGNIAQIPETIIQISITRLSVCQVVLKKKKIGARIEA